MPYSTVVVGTDDSPTALRAVLRAADVAATYSALLVVLSAYTEMPPVERAVVRGSVGERGLERLHGRAAAEQALAAATEAAEAAHAVGVIGVVAEGDPAQALLAAAQERGADLLVVGNRSVGTLTGRLLGAVGTSVTTRATCDVLVVHTTTTPGG